MTFLLFSRLDFFHILSGTFSLMLFPSLSLSLLFLCFSLFNPFLVHTLRFSMFHSFHLSSYYLRFSFNPLLRFFFFLSVFNLHLTLNLSIYFSLSLFFLCFTSLISSSFFFLSMFHFSLTFNLSIWAPFSLSISIVQSLFFKRKSFLFDSFFVALIEWKVVNVPLTTSQFFIIKV